MSRHAFLIIAHNELQVLEALLHQLDSPGFDVFLHIDAKSLEMYQRFSSYRPHQGGFHLLSQRVDLRWGDISQVDTEMLLLRTAAQHGPYAYYHILSGVDLLLKTPTQLRQAFAAHPHTEYVGYWHTPEHLRDLRRKTSRVYLFTRHMKDKGTFIHACTSFTRNVVLAVQKITGYTRPTPRGITFCKGSNWASITEECCQYLLQQEPHLHPRLRHMLCPDEIFLQTLVWNSPFRANIFCLSAEDTETSTLRKIDWHRGSPYVWTEGDVDELLSSQAVFARKFSSTPISVVNAIMRHTESTN